MPETSDMVFKLKRKGFLIEVRLADWQAPPLDARPPRRLAPPAEAAYSRRDGPPPPRMPFPLTASFPPLPRLR